ncbi:MAG: YmdB family metallophosphoesterase [Rickettsiales bacterium]|jgi:metallophosphoesterase (TIGR00282 family)|nr:YmdB family metallophosphoesterase [Rickettsiales bacterium]
MKILFFGDVVGRAARNFLIANAARIKADLGADFFIANAENAAHGYGLTPSILRQFRKAPIDAITTGDHIWDRMEILAAAKSEPRLLRPLNWKKHDAGAGYGIFKCGGKKVLVANLLGRVFIDREQVENPFVAIDSLLEQFRLGREADAIFIDFHAEATGEKMSMGYHLDGRVSAVIGSHTHIPTADERILERGTAYQTDAGMCGDFSSSIGQDKGVSIRRFLGREDEKLAPAEGPPTLCGVLIDIGADGLARGIKRVSFGAAL